MALVLVAAGLGLALAGKATHGPAFGWRQTFTNPLQSPGNP